MGIGSITSTNSMPSPQMTAANLKDQKSKSIQKEIASAQQKMQKLSSNEDLSVNEKTNEQKKLQQEISGLNTELKQHQQELSRSQKRESMMAELLENEKPADKESSQNKIQSKETVSDTSDKENLSTAEKQNARPGTVIFQNDDGTVILKDIANQDKNAGTDIKNKQTGETKEESDDTEKATASGKDTSADDSLSSREMYAMGSADSSMQQAGRLGAIVTRIRDGIAVLKGEMNQDENRGVDTERKQAELEKMEKQEQRAMDFQFSILGDASNAIKGAAETNGAANGGAALDNKNTFSISGLSIPQEEQASQQRFHVSFG